MDTTSRPHRLLLLVATVANLLLTGLGIRWLIAPDPSVLARLATPPPLLDLIGPVPMHGALVAVALVGAVTAATHLARARGEALTAGARPSVAGGRGPVAGSRWLIAVGLTQVLVFGLGFASMATLSGIGYLIALAMPLLLVTIGVLLLRGAAPGGRLLGAALLILSAAGLVLGRGIIGDLAAEMVPALLGMTGQLLLVGHLVLVGTVWAALIVLAARSAEDGGPRRVEAWVIRYRRPLTLLAACGPLPYALLRLTWLTPWPLLGGMVAEADVATRVWGLTLSAGAWLGVILTLGLIRPWGEVFPRWIPGVGGRPVPLAVVAVPGFTIAALLIFAAAPMVLSVSIIGPSMMLAFALVFPCWLWGPALALAVWGYLGHRRSTSVARPGTAPSARMGVWTSDGTDAGSRG